MARITRSTFDETKNRKKVVEQFGVPVVDNEINESQDIIMSEAVEGSRASTTGVARNTDGSVSAQFTRFGYVAGTDFRPFVSAGKIFITAGQMFVDGYRLVLPANLDLTTVGLSWPNPNAYGYIYLDITLTEVNSSVDPTMATPNIGETTVRNVLLPTWKQAEDPTFTSFGTAFSSIVELQNITNARIYKGNTARVFIGRYTVVGGVIGILSMLKATSGEKNNRQKFVKTYRPSTTDLALGVFADGAVFWNLNTSTLQIGGANFLSPGLFSNGARTGIMIRSKEAPDHIITNSVNVVAASPAGTANGPIAFPDWTKGWNIPDGSALGFTNINWPGLPASPNNEYLMKGDTDFPEVYDMNNSSFNPNPLMVQQLTVQPLDTFQSEPSTFILCTRIGSDLVWHNGQVTRGGSNTEVNFPAIDTPGEAPTTYRAVVSPGGASINGGGGNSLTGLDSLERALNFSSANNAGALSASSVSRTLRYYLKSGGGGVDYIFDRGIKKWGTQTEATTLGNSIVLEGDYGNRTLASSTRPTIVFNNPLSSTRSAADGAIGQFFASNVVLKNLTFIQLTQATCNAGYILEISGDSVEIENCTFDSAVFIIADKIKINGCTFDPISHTADAIVNDPTQKIVAQCLYLSPQGTLDDSGGTKPIDWEVKNNTLFVCNPFTAGNCGLYVNANNDGTVVIEKNIFDGRTFQTVPSIHLGSNLADITIRKNKFLRAKGQDKIGNDQSVASLPFDGHYEGSPFENYGNTSPSGPTVALGYISMPYGRDITSKTTIEDNTFDFSWVGQGSSFPYTLWGACLCVCSSQSMGPNGGYYNIKYANNRHGMAADNALGWSGTDGGGNPVTWGFYMAPMMQDALTSFIAQDITIENNTFDIGGQFGEPPNGKTWRALYSENFDTWTGVRLTDGSALIGIILRNITVAGVGMSNRNAVGISIKGNKILQRTTGNPGLPFIPDVLSLDLSNNPRYWFCGIFLSPGDQYHFSRPNVGTYIASEGFQFPDISNNTIIVPFYKDTTSQVLSGLTGIVALQPAAISAIRMFRAKISDNTIYMSVLGTTIYGSTGIQTGWSTAATAQGDGVDGNIISRNSIFAYNGVHGQDKDRLADNMFVGCVNQAFAGATTGGPATLNEVYPGSSNWT